MRWLLALSVLYLVVYLPAIGELAIYHGDERFYTNGALVMLRTGEWAAAATADGVPRFNKPLLGYWVIAGTFGSFGIGPTTSRLPSLLTGLMTAWLVWAVARRLLSDDDVALVAGAVTLTNVELGVLARRATPDMLLVGFVTLSLAGFLSDEIADVTCTRSVTLIRVVQRVRHGRAVGDSFRKGSGRAAGW